MKKVGIVILVLSLMGAIGIIWYYFSYIKSDEDRTGLVLYGNVDMRQVNLAFKVSDRIEEIKVEEGATVSRGQLLATLDNTLFQLVLNQSEARAAAQAEVVAKMVAGSRREEIDQARAEVEAARIRAHDAQRTFKRLQAIAADYLVSREQVDNAEANALAAQAALKSAQENLNLVLDGFRKEDTAYAQSELKALEATRDIARQNLMDTQLYAPVQGVIQERILQPGDMASPQQPVFTLALTDPIWIRTYVSETDLGVLFPGLPATVKTDSYPEKSYDAWVGFISPTAEFTPKTVQSPEIRTSLVYQVHVIVRNPENELRLGMPATVIIWPHQSGSNKEKQTTPSYEKRSNGE
jgi:HlyD family secretion protein